MSMYDERASSVMAASVRDVLAADADLAAFFGTENIRQADQENVEGSLVDLPALFSIPGLRANARLMGYGKPAVETKLPVHVVMFLPRATPATFALDRPVAPAVSYGDVGEGPLTGQRMWRLTSFGTRGESFASDATPVVELLTPKAPELRLVPVTGQTGWRVWRTRPGGLAFRWAATVFGTEEKTWADSVSDAQLGDELAPIRGFVRNLAEHIEAVIYDDETLRGETELDKADAVTLYDPVVQDEVDRQRNLRVVRGVARFVTRFPVDTGELEA